MDSGEATLAQDWAKPFYKSARWRKARSAYMSAEVRLVDGRMVPPFMCERCFERGRLVPAEIVHHIKHLTERNVGDPMVSTSFSNLMRVCRDCHAELHYPDDYTPRVSFDENGRVIPLA